jgi:DNA-binding transcriptional regulator LsrR (DeoR family)
MTAILTETVFDTESESERSIAFELTTKIKARIVENGWNDDEVASRLGLMRSTVDRLLADSSWPVDVAMRINDRLDLPTITVSTA